MSENLNEPRQYPLSHHVYGGKAASCWSHDCTRKDYHTIAIETAPAIRARDYDWSGKTRIQATRNELVSVAAVFAGYLPRCKFDSHGEGKDKGFSLERQDRGIFLRTWRKGAAQKPCYIHIQMLFMSNKMICLYIFNHIYNNIDMF